MSILPNRRTIRGRLHRIALAGLVGVALLGTAGVAVAQESEPPSSAEVTTTAPTESASQPAEQPAQQSSDPAEQPASGESAPPAEQPAQQAPEQDKKTVEPLKPEVVVETGCYEPDQGNNAAGFVDVKVTNPNDTTVTYKVILKTSPERDKELVLPAGANKTASFGTVPGGQFDIVVTGSNGTSASSEARLDRCDEITTPVNDELQVFVRCVDGHGVMTIYLFNLGEVTKTLTVSIDDLELGEPVELEGGTYLVYLDEAPTPDGQYVVRVKGKGVDTQETVTVACEPPPSTPSTTVPSTPPLTTVPPAPQGSAAPPGGLAFTGAAVGGVAALGVIVLALGATLVLIGRRRRPSTDQSGG